MPSLAVLAVLVLAVIAGAWFLPRSLAVLHLRLVPCLAPNVFPALEAPGRTIGMFICGAAVGFSWAAGYAHLQMRESLPAEWEGRDITLVGTVASLPNPFERGVRFDFEVERQVSPDRSVMVVPGRLALSWHGGFSDDDASAPAQLEPGERWQLTVRLRRPHGNANPHGFDYEVWLLERGVRATGYVRPDARSMHKNLRLDAFVARPGNIIERSRSWLRERIRRVLQDKPYAGVIVALVIGDQRAISQSDWEVFNRSGVGHLISISGLHITMIAGLFASAVHFLWRRSFFTRAALPLILPAQKAAAAGGVLAAFLYVLMAGFGVPAQRTLYMLTVVAAALWLGRVANVSAVLCAALAVVVLIDPWAVLWPGFWLSFAAVALIMFTTVGRAAPASAGQETWRARLLQAVRGGTRVQYAITVGLVPLTMLLFSQVSLVSPVANALAIPLISFVVTPLALMGSMLPAPFCQAMLLVAHAGVELLASLLTHLSALPAAVWQAPRPSLPAFLAALAGTLWLLAPAGWPLRWLGAVWLMPLALTAPARPEPGGLWVTALDVGQGTAVLIETHGRRLLYDTGPSFGTDGDAGERAILPYLRARGIDRLDAMMVSHGDNDHTGGALSVLSEIRVDRVSSSLPDEHQVVRRAKSHARCRQGESWTWDGVHFELLYPSAGQYARKKSKPNHRSCTLKITAGSHSVLLPGDIEAPQEAELVAGLGDKLAATVLFAPHHGSGTSSTPAFLDAVRPEIVVFQLGYRNRYRHPKTEVWQRYAERGVQRLRTDVSGAISLRFGEQVEVGEYRVEHGRYWYNRQQVDTGMPPQAASGEDSADAR
ncbi:MAG TPA: DNA internalization-related competence protein ComEC/Rec2 [Noviherbaspirillum sp.]|uniref:DNA internalization-related competence protein ComEC/Rec2 n=1 Tax=Noviherbaspirillum sp. TaxID=1926288 RepID=UPI002F95DDA0